MGLVFVERLVTTIVHPSLGGQYCGHFLKDQTDLFAFWLFRQPDLRPIMEEQFHQKWKDDAEYRDLLVRVREPAISLSNLVLVIHWGLERLVRP
jgi:hypothetical protein